MRTPAAPPARRSTDTSASCGSLRVIVRGDSNKQIARALDIAETTVKIHVQHILRKLNLTNRVHAAVYASERGIGPL